MLIYLDNEQPERAYDSWICAWRGHDLRVQPERESQELRICISMQHNLGPKTFQKATGRTAWFNTDIAILVYNTRASTRKNPGAITGARLVRNEKDKKNKA